MREQIEHKISFLKQECIGKDHPPLVLIGHSIGAYMALHASKSIEEGSISEDKSETKQPKTHTGGGQGAEPRANDKRTSDVVPQDDGVIAKVTPSDVAVSHSIRHNVVQERA